MAESVFGSHGVFWCDVLPLLACPCVFGVTCFVCSCGCDCVRVGLWVNRIVCFAVSSCHVVGVTCLWFHLRHVFGVTHPVCESECAVWCDVFGATCSVRHVWCGVFGATCCHFCCGCVWLVWGVLTCLLPYVQCVALCVAVCVAVCPRVHCHVCSVLQGVLQCVAVC